LDANIEFGFHKLIHDLQQWTDEQDVDALEGGLIALIPRHSDAVDGGVIFWAPENREDADHGVLVRELFTSVCWTLMSLGVSKEEVIEAAQQAGFYFDQYDITISDEESEGN
jgi:hypothetical protein